MHHSILNGPCLVLVLAALLPVLAGMPVQALADGAGAAKTAAKTMDAGTGVEAAAGAPAESTSGETSAAPADAGAAPKEAAAPAAGGAAADRVPSPADGDAVDVRRLWPPVDALVTSPFGERRGPRFGRPAGRHGGLDIRARIGWPVRSLQDGVVQRAGRSGAAGIMVQVRQDNGHLVSYAHLQQALVKQGQKVTRGQYVGRVGCTGRTTGAHLHISVRGSDGRPMDPRQQIAGLWELFDPAPEELTGPIEAMACPMSERIKGSPNRRLIGQQHYLRMQKLARQNRYRVPDLP